MRLSTLVLAWVFAVATGGAALANSQESAEMAAPAEAVAEMEEAIVEPGEELSLEDSAALEALAPEAAAPAEAASGVETSPESAALAVPDAGLPEAGVTDTEVMQARETVTWDDFEDPGFDPSTPAAPSGSGSTPAARLSAKAAAIPLGPLALDDSGVKGRIHTVSRGETLWDISEAYLGTPWVWPSVWHENDGIDNPHVIVPGDRIWITSNEMRRISDEEADEMVAAVGEDDTELEIVSDDSGMEFLPEDDTLAYDEAAEPMPAAVEDEPELSLVVPMEGITSETGEVIVLPRATAANFATASMMDEATRIVDAPTLRAFLAEGDEVYLPLGEGEAQVGDEYEIFRDVVKVRDIETRAVLGYHYEELGWLRITKVEGESSVAVIRGSSSEIQRGDRLVPRNEPPQEIAVRRALEDIEGAIVFTPGIRWMRGTTDSVYINVGSIHGVEVGTRMQVIDYGRVQAKAMMPDTIIAELVVIDVEPEASIAYITETQRELEVGDDVRGVLDEDPSAMP